MSLSPAIAGLWMVDLGAFVNTGFSGWKWLAFCVITVWALGAGFVYSAPLGLDTKSAPEPSKTDALSKELEQLGNELERLEKQESKLKQKRVELNLEIQGAPQLADQLRLEIRRLEQGAANGEKPIPDSQTALDKAISLLDNQARALQQSLSFVLENIGDQQALPSKARSDVQEAQRDEQAAKDRLKELESSNKNSSLKTMQVAVVKQQINNAELRKSLAQNRLEGYQRLLELHTVNRDLLLLQLDMIKSALEVLREKRDEMRLNSVDQQKDSLVELSRHYNEVPKVLVNEQKENRKLNQLLVSVTESLTSASDRLADGKQELQEVKYRAELAKQQLELTDFYQYVDDYLLRQRQVLQVKIREHENDEGLSTEISKARLRQFRLDEKLHQVRTETSRKQLIAQQLDESKIDSKFRQLADSDLYKIYSLRAETLNKLVQVNADYVVGLTNLEILYEDQYEERTDFYELLNKELFWRKSATPLSLKWFRMVPGSVIWFIQEHKWSEPLRIWYEVLVKPVLPLLGLVVMTIIGVITRKRLRVRLERLQERVGNVTKDKFRYTLEALLITVYMALPIPVLLAVLGFPLVLNPQASLFTDGIGKAILLIARWFFFFELIRQLCRRHGLALEHFQWRAHGVTALKRYLPLLYLQLPWSFVFVVVWREGDDFHSGVLGRASFLMTVFFLFLFNLKLFNPKQGIFKHGAEGPASWFQRWNKPVFWLAILMPAALLALSFQGYSFSAMELMVLLFYSFMLGFLILILDQVLHRWFSVVERKLAYRRAIEKRDAIRKAKEQQEASKSSGEAIPEIEMPKLDVSTISEQNRALLRVFSCSLFILVCYWVWSDFIQAAQIFQEITLWSYTTETDMGTEIHKVALGTILITFLVLALTYIGVKNLPGLIEVMILQRFSVDQGVRFAITSTARYLVIAAGIMVASSQLGLDWSKLGWLVAALGVGLGFGLQEIFANFISGLIILYERPIRIGDTVTINDLSGTVYKINMRATTITDWDMKELIIPNKTFVTNQFINWTLSDTTTRLVLKVGVAYGSDTKLVTRLLLDIAKQHEDVLNEPAPSAFFLGFGDSTLNFELRVFVAKFGNRLPLLHNLNTEVDLRFKQAGIEIAFPQLDLHVKDVAAVTGTKAFQQPGDEPGKGAGQNS
ncbi:MAG: hypothetical protein D6160_09525 [Ketobacter sp.]|nr:MAG: hypothetical protein D6160_09525 [Ketobacter sp.]